MKMISHAVNSTTHTLNVSQCPFSPSSCGCNLGVVLQMIYTNYTLTKGDFK